MSVEQVVVWVLGPLVLLVASVLACWRWSPLGRSIVVATPVLAAFVAVLFDVRVAAPSHFWSTLAACAVTACAVVGGSPVTTTVLALADRPRTPSTSEDDDRVLRDRLRGAPSTTRRDQLRGGAAIGYLERLAVIGALLLGRFEIVAAVVAVKGLGRFTELQSAELRERFIVGTLASGTWATVCGLLVTLPS